MNPQSKTDGSTVLINLLVYTSDSFTPGLDVYDDDGNYSDSVSHDDGDGGDINNDEGYADDRLCTVTKV